MRTRVVCSREVLRNDYRQKTRLEHAAVVDGARTNLYCPSKKGQAKRWRWMGEQTISVIMPDRFGLS